MPPCGVTGECSDCSAPRRIYNKTVIIEREHRNERYDPAMSVIIVGEVLGI